MAQCNLQVEDSLKLVIKVVSSHKVWEAKTTTATIHKWQLNLQEEETRTWALLKEVLLMMAMEILNRLAEVVKVVEVETKTLLVVTTLLEEPIKMSNLMQISHRDEAEEATIKELQAQVAGTTAKIKAH